MDTLLNQSKTQLAQIRVFQQNALMMRFYNIWKQKVTLNQSRYRGIQKLQLESNLRRKYKVFKQWRLEFRSQDSRKKMKATLNNSLRQFTIKKAWKFWTRLAQLKSLEKFLTMRKGFKLILGALRQGRRRIKMLVKATELHDRHLVKRVVVAWKETTLAHKSIAFRNASKVDHFFKLWRTQFTTKKLHLQLLSSLPKYPVLSKAFSKWNSVTDNLVAIRTGADRRVLQLCFNIWKAAKAPAVPHKSDSVFEYHGNYTIEHLKMVRLADKFTLKSYSKRWATKYKQIRLAENYYLKNYYTLWNVKTRVMKTNITIAEKMYDGSLKKKLVSSVSKLGKFARYTAEKDLARTHNLYRNWKAESARLRDAQRLRKTGLLRFAYNQIAQKRVQFDIPSLDGHGKADLSSKRLKILKSRFTYWRTLCLGKIVPSITSNRSLRKHFNIWRTPIQLDSDELLFKVAIQKHRKQTLKKYLINWKLQYFLHYSQQNNLKRIFKRFLVIAKIHSQRLISSDKYQQNTLQELFRKWHIGSQLKIGKIHERKSFKSQILRTYFENWQKALLFQRANNFSDRKRLYFNKLKKRIYDKKLKNEIAQIKYGNSTAARFFWRWLYSIDDSSIADQTYIRSVLRRFFRQWFRQTFAISLYLANLVEGKSYTIADSTVNDPIFNIYHVGLQKKAFDYWKTHSEARLVAKSLHGTNLLSRYFKTWVQIRSGYNLADQNIERKSFFFWKLKGRLLASQDSDVRKIQGLRTANAVLQFWKSRYLLETEMGTMHYRNNSLSSYFWEWKAKTYQLLNEKAGHDYASSKAVVSSFTKWINRFHLLEQTKTTAIDFKSQKLVFKAFVFWRNYTNQRSDMLVIAENYESQTILSKCLYTWKSRFLTGQLAKQTYLKKYFMSWNARFAERSKEEHRISEFSLKTSFRKWRTKAAKKNKLVMKLNTLRKSVKRFFKFKRSLVFKSIYNID